MTRDEIAKADIYACNARHDEIRAEIDARPRSPYPDDEAGRLGVEWSAIEHRRRELADLFYGAGR